MSNRAHIQQEEKKTHHSGEVTRIVSVWDDYADDYVDLEVLCPDGTNKWFEDELELLKAVLDHIFSNKGSKAMGDVINYVQENENGLYVEGTWYNWEQIKHLFEVS
jgi:uncharacterized protein YfaP (DUF2135 family)